VIYSSSYYLDNKPFLSTSTWAKMYFAINLSSFDARTWSTSWDVNKEAFKFSYSSFSSDLFYFFIFFYFETLDGILGFDFSCYGCVNLSHLYNLSLTAPNNKFLASFWTRNYWYFWLYSANLGFCLTLSYHIWSNWI
jgi:hypothetical protein